MLTVSATSCLPFLCLLRNTMTTMATTNAMRMIDPTVAPIISSVFPCFALVLGINCPLFLFFGAGSGKRTGPERDESFPVLKLLWLPPPILKIEI